MSSGINLLLALSWTLIIVILVMAFIGPGDEQTRNRKDEDL